MIDTQTVLPAGVCAKADKFSFSDFLPRVISYFTVEGKQYAMPFNTSGPVLYYNKKAFTAAGLDPETAAQDARRGALRRGEAQGQRGARRRSGSRPSPGTSSTGARWPTRTYVNNSNGRKARATKTGLRRRHRAADLHLALGHGEGRPRHHERRPRYRQLRQPARHPERFARDGVRHQRRARHHQLGARRRAAHRTSSSAWRRSPSPGKKATGGVLVSGGALYMVNKSAPAKQAAAWKFLKFLDDPRT